MTLEHPFRPALFRFFRDLAENNRRDWFDAHRGDYEDHVRGPAMEFIAACAPGLRKLSPHLVADPRPQGASLFRLHRDLRFSKDKSPFKTSLGIRFFHERRKEGPAPGFYLHLEAGKRFAGLGLWRPDATTARQVRQAIVDDPAGWKRATRSKAFLARWSLDGDSLARAPKGFDPDHPWIDDLRRKDFIAGAKLTQREVTAKDFDRTYLELCKTGTPMVRFLCKAIGAPF